VDAHLDYMHVVDEMVEMRTKAGDHPHDIMTTAWTMLEVWVRVNVDGSWPKNEPRLEPSPEQNLGADPATYWETPGDASPASSPGDTQ